LDDFWLGWRDFLAEGPVLLGDMIWFQLVLRDYMAVGSPVVWHIDAVSTGLPVVCIFYLQDLKGAEPLPSELELSAPVRWASNVFRGDHHIVTYLEH
jgi:hypothetical protein